MNQSTHRDNIIHLLKKYKPYVKSGRIRFKALSKLAERARKAQRPTPAAFLPGNEPRKTNTGGGASKIICSERNDKDKRSQNIC
jgi:hypothetical protein